MPKHPHRDFRNFYIKDVPQDTFCPLCHRAIRYAVPATETTYLVHAIDDVCVMDNVPVSLFDGTVKHG